MYACLYVLLFPHAGAGKTYTMLGTESDPGIMVLTLNSLFETIEDTSNDVIYRVTMAYMEVRCVGINYCAIHQWQPSVCECMYMIYSGGICLCGYAHVCVWNF